ncbi:hypothetical protein TCT1_37940 (plasmid) [Xenorhabdus sp. TCT-1]|uniref:DUF4158 domain-containing protein n=1 Tax=Xenorhabdus taiwanensis TaxID=3085177 RepID=A0ABN7C8E9_9GAMM|nr:hypothetical protein TCT1_36380 [Xenorhabdus sp. TCT-1]BET98873.1 hypothetical protein TCT1_37940 [Xenorhabdus sp. TCT-1]
MPVNFLSEEQRANYGSYPVELTKETLARYFHLDDFDRLNISEKRGEHNRLGFAILLYTVRYLGKFPAFPIRLLNVWHSHYILKI